MFNNLLSFIKNNFKLHTIESSKGDVLYLYTDGYADQFGGPKGKKFKYKQLNELLLSEYEKPLNVQHENIKKAFETWQGNLEQVDDVCILGIRIQMKQKSFIWNEKYNIIIKIPQLRLLFHYITFDIYQ